MNFSAATIIPEADFEKQIQAFNDPSFRFMPTWRVVRCLGAGSPKHRVSRQTAGEDVRLSDARGGFPAAPMAVVRLVGAGDDIEAWARVLRSWSIIWLGIYESSGVRFSG